MSAQSAEVVTFPSSRRTPDASPVHKLRVMEECRRRVQARELRRTAIVVLGYLAECIDKETGLATLRLRTIAAATTYSRGEVGKAVQELVATGLVERVSNRRGNECLAASFRLLDPTAGRRQAHRLQATGPSPTGDTSRGFVNPSTPSGSNPRGLSLSAAKEKTKLSCEDPRGFQPDSETQAFAKRKGFDDESLREEVDAYIDWVLSKGVVFADMNAGCRRWLRRRLELDGEARPARHAADREIGEVVPSSPSRSGNPVPPEPLSDVFQRVGLPRDEEDQLELWCSAHHWVSAQLGWDDQDAWRWLGHWTERLGMEEAFRRLAEIQTEAVCTSLNDVDEAMEGFLNGRADTSVHA